MRISTKMYCKHHGYVKFEMESGGTFTCMDCTNKEPINDPDILWKVIRVFVECEFDADYIKRALEDAGIDKDVIERIFKCV